MAPTKTEAALEAAEQAHADDPERAELLSRARRFKSSWLELAESLSEVRRRSQWKRWGFSSFEEYGKKELHLRQETLDKLTGSYQFLQRSAPEVLRRDGVGSPIPSYQSVDFLRRAEEKEAPIETLSELRRKVIDDAAPLPGLSRKYREVLFPLDNEERRARDTTALKATARRLRELLSSSPVAPKKLAAELNAGIERLLAALEKDEAAAAE